MLSRLWNSAVIWFWAFNGVRLAYGLLLLPLIAHLLSKADLGLYFALLNIVAVAQMLDIGMSAAIDRHVSYASGGARELKAHGLQLPSHPDCGPNKDLLWQLLDTTRVYYRYVSLVFIVLFGTIGTVILAGKMHETSSLSASWGAWTVALLSAALEIYASWWNVFLRGMNQVVVSGRIQFLAQSMKLLLAALLLIAGAGLPGIFVAGAISGFITRFLSRRACLRCLGPRQTRPVGRAQIIETLKVLWPNGWRVGLQLFSSYLVSLTLLEVCSRRYGLAGYSVYGLSLQVLSIVQGISLVWTSVKWPEVGQLRARHDHAGLRRVLWPRLWLQAVTFVLLAVAAHQLGPELLGLVRSDKQLLPPLWFFILLLAGFFDSQVTFWTTFLSTENRVPSLWPVTFTNLINLGLVLVLLGTTSIGLGAFALSPFIAGALFNYWYWPVAGARNLKTTWFHFTFRGP